MKKKAVDNYTSELFPELVSKPVEKVIPINNKIITFGQYKGQPFEVLENDQSYCKFLLSDPSFKDRHFSLYQFIINNFGASEDTPEHNAMQIRFQNMSFSMALAKLCAWKPMRKKSCNYNLSEAMQRTSKLLNNNYYGNHDKMEELKSRWEFLKEDVIEIDGLDYIWGEKEYPLFETQIIMEEQGWDVVIQSHNSYCKDECPGFKDCYIQTHKIAVEIKPIINEDYPSVLREMDKRPFHPDYICLVYGEITASTATVEQVKTYFTAKNYKVFSFAEIEKAELGD